MNNPLIVGYKGNIGSFLLQGLLREMPKALNIHCVDINETQEEVAERIHKADTIFLCVPFKDTVEWIAKHIPILTNKTIIEQCSLKEWIYKDERLRTIAHQIKSMHILFRPSATPNRNDREVVLLHTPNYFTEEEHDLIERITQAKIHYLDSPKEHDKEMAIQQALVHRTIIALGDMLDNGKCSTFIGKKIKELRDRILAGDKDLLKFIQDNPHLNTETFTNNIKKFTI